MFKEHRIKFSIVLLVILPLTLCLFLTCSCLTLENTLLANSRNFGGQNEVDVPLNPELETDGPLEPTSTEGECKDDYSPEYCEKVIRDRECNLDEKAWNCRESCHLCTKEMSNEERSDKCKDKLPQCDVVANPMICCGIKPMANFSCAEACKFCHNIIVPTLPTFLPGMQPPPPQENPVVYSDPCDPSKPPSTSGGGVPPMPGSSGGGGSSGSGSSGLKPPNFAG